MKKLFKIPNILFLIIIIFGSIFSIKCAKDSLEENTLTEIDSLVNEDLETYCSLAEKCDELIEQRKWAIERMDTFDWKEFVDEYTLDSNLEILNKVDGVDVATIKILLKNIDGTYFYRPGEFMTMIFLVQNLSPSEVNNIIIAESSYLRDEYITPSTITVPNGYSSPLWFVGDLGPLGVAYGQYTILTPQIGDEAAIFMSKLDFINCTEFELGRDAINNPAQADNNDWRISTNILPL